MAGGLGSRGNGGKSKCCNGGRGGTGGPMADDLLATMKAGRTLDVAMRATDGQDIGLRVPLTGFSAGYAAIE